MPHSRTVLVTGGTGYLGTLVVRALKAEKRDVVVISRSTREDALGVDLSTWNEATWPQLQQAPRAIVHLAAAVPGRSAASAAELFANNVVATRNVLDFARTAGVNKVVIASSESVLGLAYNDATASDAFIQYLPVDEAHPVRPTDPYSLSKITEELLCDAYAHNCSELSITSLRFSWILDESTYQTKLPAAQMDERRGASKLFSYVDVRDAAAACLLALNYREPGHERLFIAGGDTTSLTHSATLASDFFPLAQDRLRAELWFQSLISTEKASSMLGYFPQHSWRHTATGGG